MCISIVSKRRVSQRFLQLIQFTKYVSRMRGKHIARDRSKSMPLIKEKVTEAVGTQDRHQRYWFITLFIPCNVQRMRTQRTRVTTDHVRVKGFGHFIHSVLPRTSRPVDSLLLSISFVLLCQCVGYVTGPTEWPVVAGVKRPVHVLAGHHMQVRQDV